MNIPEINVAPVHRVFLHVLNKEIEYRPYNIGHEKLILTALESDNINDLITNYLFVLKDCLITEIDIDELSLIDFVKIVVFLRSKSTDEILTLKRNKCSECEKSYEFKLDVEKSLVYKDEDKIKSVIKISDELSFELCPTNFLITKTISNEDDKYDKKLNKIAFSTKRIIFNKQIIKNEDPQELIKNVIKNLSAAQIKILTTEIDKLITLSMEIKTKCPFCNKEEFDQVIDFLGYIK